MKLEEIYHILKTSSLIDFYIPREAEKTIFVYKANVAISIAKESEEKSFEDYFFDTDGNEITDLAPFDELVKDLCRLKDFPETYKNIFSQIWSLKYNGQVVFTFSCGIVQNPSSLQAAFPFSLNILDFEMNFINLLNEHYGANTLEKAKNIISSSVSVKDSTYQDFLRE